METKVMNMENSKINESYKFFFNFLQILDLRSSKKHFALQNLSTYYTCKNIRQQCKNRKFKTIFPTWNDEFELPERSHSVSNIQDYINYKII